jgi:predicted nucleic-acid-binding protein
MRAVVDTSVVVRHLVGDHPVQSRRATRLLSSNHELFISHLIFAETVYVLESFYELPREQVAVLCFGLLALPAIIVTTPRFLVRALVLYVDARIDFADAYAAAQAELGGVGRVASFDRSLDRVESIERIEP